MAGQIPFLDLRSFVDFLDHSHRLKRVRQEVDKDWQIACISRWAVESMHGNNGYALMFENVKNHTDAVVVNLYFNYEIYAAALGIQADGVLEHWAGALAHTYKSVLTTHAAVQEVVRTAGKCDLLEIPAPVWTPGRDAGPYLSAANVITKDPDTGIQNVGNYRIQIHESKRAGLFFGTEAQHGAIHYAKYCKRSQPMP